MKPDRTKCLKIGEISRLVEMSPRTIRYYEEIGLLNSAKRVEGGKRVYTEKDLQRLRFIRRLKHLGLTLSEMTELEGIDQVDRTNRKVLSRLLELMEGHARKIDERINNLVRLKSDILSYQEKIRRKMGVEERARR